jgi:hypothetical protein
VRHFTPLWISHHLLVTLQVKSHVAKIVRPRQSFRVTRIPSTTLTFRLPSVLARKIKAKARAEKTTPSAVLTDAVRTYVYQSADSILTPFQRHINERAGKWDGDISGEELLKLTRP